MPLDNIHKRYSIYHISNIVFLVLSIACTFSSDMGMFLCFQLCQALCPPLVLCGGMVANPMLLFEWGRTLAI